MMKDYSRLGYTGKAGTKEDRSGNYKLQNTKYKQIPIPKLQITNKEVSYGQFLDAFDEGLEPVFYARQGGF